MKDITNEIMNSIGENIDISAYKAAVKGLMGALVEQSVKDLYIYKFLLRKELAKESPSKKLVNSYTRELQNLDHYFNSNLYTKYSTLSKETIVAYVDKMLTMPHKVVFPVMSEC